MKVEFLHHYRKRHGLRLKDRLIAYLPRYAPIAARLAPLANARPARGAGRARLCARSARCRSGGGDAFREAEVRGTMPTTHPHPGPPPEEGGETDEGRTGDRSH